MNLRAIGFCGVDDSIDPQRLVDISQGHPNVEWGVLVRPGFEGKPRFPSAQWLGRLLAARQAAPGGPASVRLAAHLCGAALNAVLGGDSSLPESLATAGFGRLQLNATVINGAVVPPHGSEKLLALLPTVDVEWILQHNAETAPLWEPILDLRPAERPGRLSVLFDASAGRGESPAGGFPARDVRVPSGFAGGIGPSNLESVLHQLLPSRGLFDPSTSAIWVDMESSLRDVRGVANSVSSSCSDTFALDRVLTCLEIYDRFITQRQLKL